jgi:hypothetical protein
VNWNDMPMSARLAQIGPPEAIRPPEEIWVVWCQTPASAKPVGYAFDTEEDARKLHDAFSNPIVTARIARYLQPPF